MVEGQARADGHRGRWTIKRASTPPDEGERHARPPIDIAVSVFGYKNHLGIDRRHGFIRRFVVTDAGAHDGRRQLAELLDRHNTASGVWTDSAYRSAAKLALLARRGLVPHLQRPKPPGNPMPPHVVRRNASRARVRVAVEHVFAAQKCRLGLLIRSVGLARATARLGLVNLVTNMRRLVWYQTRSAPV